MSRALLPGEPVPGEVTDEGRLNGYYKEVRLPAFYKVEGDRVSWHEGGRETEDKGKIEYGVFEPVEEIMMEVTGIQNYNFKMIEIGKVQEE